MGEPAGGGCCIPMLGGLRPIERTWVSTTLIRSVLRPDENSSGAWRRNRRRPGECRAGLVKYAAARPLFALWAGRMAASGITCRGIFLGSDVALTRAPKVPPIGALLLLIRSSPGPPQSTGARFHRARTLFGVKPAGGGHCISTLGAVCPIEGV